MTAIESHEHWQSLFENWPDVIQRRGTIITKQGESVPVINFLISSNLLLIERDGPDSTGARKAIVPYDAIAMLKLAATCEMSLFQSMGFQPSL